MSKLLLALAIISCVFLVPSKQVVKPAYCAFCLSDTCSYGIGCGSQCTCVTKGGESEGVCYSIE